MVGFVQRNDGKGMLNIHEESCCGCMACVQKCPKQCICILTNNKGFDYPKIDSEQCVDCHLCESVCPVVNIRGKAPELKCYAVKNKNREILKECSSGAFFSVIAKYVLSKKGIIFAARFDSSWNVVHSKCVDEIELNFFYGSKYVQSKIGYTFKEIETSLKENRFVLFVGTPCQVAGLHNFLRKQYKNLLTVDFLCHGVPSPGVWKEYLNEEVSALVKHSNLNTENIRITNVRFRDKPEGWKKYHFVLECMDSQNDKKINLSTVHYNNPYMKGFINDLYLRESCFTCLYKNNNSGSDFTIGDFWRARSLYPKFYDKQGVSLVIAKSEKAIDMMRKFDVDFINISYDDIKKSNPSIEISAVHSDLEKKFWEKREQGNDIIEAVNSLIPNKKESLSFSSVVGDIVYFIRKVL